ncbi:MAG: methyltransferase [Planctomycetota bacterium]|jgi:protein-S-isoprenylcysteine O-methyltransferase Ste14/HEAT repeat protein
MRRTLVCTSSLILAVTVPSQSPPSPTDEEGVFFPFVTIPPHEIRNLVPDLGTPKGKEAYNILTRTTQEAFPEFARILNEADPHTVDRVLEVLADHLDPEAGTVIRDLAIHGKERWRRIAALNTLLLIARESGVDFLRPLGPLLGSDTPKEIRIAVLAILQAQPVPPLIPRLLALLASPDPELHAEAAAALSSLVALHEDSATHLARTIDSIEPESTRLSVARTLVGIRNDAAIETINRLLEAEDATVRLEALKAIRDPGEAEPFPPALYRRLLDPDNPVFEVALRILSDRGGAKDVPELIDILEEAKRFPDRQQKIAELLEGLAGTRFDGDPLRVRKWSLAWMAGKAGERTAPGKAEVIPPDPLHETGPPRNPFPWAAFLMLGLLAVLAVIGLLFSGTPQKDATPPGAVSEEVPSPRETDVPPSSSFIGRTGKWIFDHRVVLLFPWFLPPLLLFETQRTPSWGWRAAFYALLLLGAILRVWCTGFRTWAYRSSGERHLMTAGPYGVVRHPIYMANFLLAVPLFLVVNVWPLTVAFVLWFAFTHLAIVAREDEILETRYGTEWRTYASVVRRFLPRFPPYHRRTGAFSWEPVFKGMEIPKATAIAILLPLVVELFPGRWTALAAIVRKGLGL